MRIVSAAYLHKLCVLYPITAVVYVAHAFIINAKRTQNRILWQSSFAYNQAKPPFASGTRQNVANAMYQWDDVNTGARFNVDELCQSCGTGSQNVFVGQVAFRAAGYDPNSPGVTHHTFNMTQISYSSIWLNNEWSWDTQGCNVDFNTKYADSRIILTHEVGHAVGLSHDSNHREAVMWPDNTCKLTTVADDDAGVRFLYGNR
jgi:hypothetical protein